MPRRVYLVVDAPEGGIYRSDDAGATWTRTSSDQRVWSRGWYFGGITVEPKNRDVVYSINVNVYCSEDGGRTFVPVKGAPRGGERDNLAPDPRDASVLYGGRVEKLDLRTMQTQSIDPTLAYPGNDRHTWTLPLVFSPRDPRVLYFSNQRLFRTEDGGNHWTLI